jgi:hypothetical protein
VESSPGKEQTQAGTENEENKKWDTTAVQKCLAQYGFGPTAGDETQRRPTEERQQPSPDEEEHNRERMPELTLTAALSATPGRESCAEGQDSAKASRPTVSQDYLLTLGEENRRTEVAKSNSQQDYKTTC